MKAIGYVRVSTNEQLDKYGVEAQKEAISKYAQEHGYEIERFLVDSVSGVKEEREQWNVIMQESIITNPPYEAIIAFKSDRVARDVKLYYYYFYQLQKRDIKLVSVQEDFDSMGEFADVLRTMMLFVAEQERKNIKIRTSAGRGTKASIGGYAGGRVPFGYTNIKGELSVVATEAEVVRLVFNLRSKGMSMDKIAIELNKRGCETKNGGKWYASTIKAILDNEKLYLGYYHYGNQKEWVIGKQEPILNK